MSNFREEEPVKFRVVMTSDAAIKEVRGLSFPVNLRVCRMKFS